jgi:uncharacterized membrane protein (DUF2068 family)
VGAGGEGGTRPGDVMALVAFFSFGAMVSGLTLLMLLSPGSWADPIWRLKPSAQAVFRAMGALGPLLMLLVSAACAAAAIGLWRSRRWGYWLAVGVLGTNLLGDLVNGVWRHDWKTLIGVPIAGAMLIYLARSQVRSRFRAAG